MKQIHIQDFVIDRFSPLTFICGPCVIEGEENAFSIAKELKKLFSKFSFQLIFKASYDKANRSSINSYRGPGLKEGLRILETVKKELQLPLITDVHTPTEAKEAAAVCDMIQIPAFLCRQTDLLIAAAKTKKPINVKKGQFLAPWDMKNVLEKIESQGNEQILLTERGFSFGYNNLVTDFRSIPIMQNFGYPVCFDASHSVQLPGGEGKKTGGNREYIPTLAKAAVAVGANVIFLEVHPDPEKGLSDQSSMYPLESLPHLLEDLEKIHQAVSCSKSHFS